MKVIVTGGHPAPALAFIDAARASQRFRQTEFVFVGRHFNNNREHSVSFEYQEVTARKIPFHHLPAGRLTRILSWHAFREMLYIPYGFIKAIRILEREQPDAVMTFGGYIALPVAFAARLANVPVYLHEQTIAPGIASKWIAKVAKKVFLSFPDEHKDFADVPTEITGNLVRDLVLKPGKLPFALPDTVPLLYVTGGSLGSHSLNAAIEKILPELLKNFAVIHQVGNMKEFDDYARLKNKAATLTPELKKRYIVVEHVNADQIGPIFQSAAVVISRSGANTLTELIALQKPAILVPLPWSARNEQRLQAQLMEKAGVAQVFEQDGDPERLLSLIHDTYRSRASMKADYQSLLSLFNPDAALRILQEIHTT